MIRLMHPEKRHFAERILSIPKKRCQKQLVGFLHPDEALKVFDAVDLKTYYGFRDYTILNLLYDSGARASEVASLSVDYFDPENCTLAILGKGNYYRQIELFPKTVQLVTAYLKKYRKKPGPLYQKTLFINQRGASFTRHGIYRICKKYLRLALSCKRLRDINPAHSFRHGCAVRMLLDGKPLSEIKNRLGHANIQSTMTYLHMNISYKRDVQKKFMEHAGNVITQDPKIDDLIDWENKHDTLAWLDTL